MKHTSGFTNDSIQPFLLHKILNACGGLMSKENLCEKKVKKVLYVGIPSVHSCVWFAFPLPCPGLELEVVLPWRPLQVRRSMVGRRVFVHVIRHHVLDRHAGRQQRAGLFRVKRRGDQAVEVQFCGADPDLWVLLPHQRSHNTGCTLYPSQRGHANPTAIDTLQQELFHIGGDSFPNLAFQIRLLHQLR